MSVMDNMWTEAPVGGSSKSNRKMDTIPDGVYDTEVVDFSCFRGDTGDWFIAWWFAVIAGLLDGKLLQRFMRVTDNSAPISKGDLRLVAGRVPAWEGDLAIEQTGQTGPFRQEVIGAKVRVRQRSRRVGPTTYVDVHIVELLQAAPSPGAGDHPSAVEPVMAAAILADDTPYRQPDCRSCGGAGCPECEAF